jgi:hypothetical protein
MRTDGTSRGDVSAETAAVFGALMVMVFLIIGAASYSIASHVASVGALQGARRGSTVMGGGETVFVAAAERVDTVVRVPPSPCLCHRAEHPCGRHCPNDGPARVPAGRGHTHRNCSGGGIRQGG